MRYNILGFDQKKLVEKYSNLNGNDIIVLRAMFDILDRLPRKIDYQNATYVQLTYDMLLSEIPFVTQSVSTLKKIVQKFIDAELIERHVVKKGGNYTYFRITNHLVNLQYHSEAEETESNETEGNIEVIEESCEIISEVDLREEISYDKDRIKNLAVEFGACEVMQARNYMIEKFRNGTRIKNPYAYMRTVLSRKYYVGSEFNYE